MCFISTVGDSCLQEYHFVSSGVVIGPPSHRGSYKITIVCVSVHPSVRHFCQERLISFFWFFALWLVTWIFKHWQGPLFSKIIHFCKVLCKKGPKWPQIRVLWIFWNILSLVFLRKSIKNEKFAISLQYMKENIKKEADFIVCR